MDPTLIIAILIGTAFATLVGGAIAIWNEKQSPAAEARLAQMLSVRPQSFQRSWLRKASWSERIQATIGVFGRAATWVHRFVAAYEQADISISLPQFLLLTSGLAWVSGVALPMYFGDARLFPAGFAIGIAIPTAWVYWRRRNRLRQFSIQLPEALDLLSRAIRSGQSLNSAMRAITEELLPPISTEFERVGDEVALGTPLDTALESLLLRVPSEDLRFFVTAVVIQKHSGGNLAEVLDKISRCVRERFRIEGQVHALTGEGRISGIVLMILPVVAFFGMLAMNPEYMELLFEDPLGQKMLQISIGLQILGACVIQRIVKIDV